MKKTIKEIILVSSGGLLLLLLLNTALNRYLTEEKTVISEVQQKELGYVLTENNIKYKLNSIYAEGELDIKKWRNSGKPVIISFIIESSEVCKEMVESLKNIKEKYKDEIIIKIVDVEKCLKEIGKYPIEETPTQMVFDKNGKAYRFKDDIKTKEYVSVSDKNDIIVLQEGPLSIEQLELVVKELIERSDDSG